MKSASRNGLAPVVGMVLLLLGGPGPGVQALTPTAAGPGHTVLAGPGTTTGSGSGRGVWRTYDITHGLASADVRAVHQDREGNLWLATYGGGLSRYDGHRFHNLEFADALPSLVVTAIAEDAAGDLWFGTDRGVARYDGDQVDVFDEDDGLSSNAVRALAIDARGWLWVATDRGASHYDGERFVSLTRADGLAADGVYTVFADRGGTVWLGTEGGGVSRYDDGRLTTLSADALGDGWVNAIAEDSTGAIWLGTRQSGLLRYDEGELTSFTVADGLAHNEVEFILVGSDGHLWIGTGGGGLCRYDGVGFTTYTVQDGLAYNWVTDGLEDGNGRLWFATAGGGMSRFEGRALTSFTVADGLVPNEVYSILQDHRGDFWFGTLSGLCRFDGDHFTTFTTADGLGGAWVEGLVEDRLGNLWIGTFGGGLTRFDGTSFTTLTTADGLPSDEVRTVAADPNGDLWVGTRGGGVSRYDGRTFHNYGVEDGLAADDVHDIAVDGRGRVWFGTTGGGVSRLEEGRFDTYTADDGLAGNTVYSIYADADTMWFGTMSGVSKWHDGKFTTYSSIDGLSGMAVQTILRDRWGRLWLGTEGGGANLFDGHVFQSITTTQGLASNSVWALVQSNDGDLWLGTSSGVTRYRRGPAQPPRAMIPAVVADRRHEGVQELAVSSSVARIVFELGRLDWADLSRATYRYRLAGLETDWLTTTSSHVEYEDLPVGSYTFEVLAVDRDLTYSERPATVRLEVQPPYALLGLGVSLALAVVALIGVSLYALRRRADARQAELALMEEMQHELQTAHELQMGLMPVAAPEVGGLDISARCVPAAAVGGDLFQYFAHGGTLTVAITDVTGHGMEAAIPAVMFDGVLHNAITAIDDTPGELLGRLTATLHHKLDARTLVCCCVVRVDTRTGRAQVANAGCPFPLLYSGASKTVSEIEVGGYPLGVREDTAYTVHEFDLGPGDRLVLCSDGIAEARDDSGDEFGFDRVAQTLKTTAMRTRSAADVVAGQLDAVDNFAGGATREDDQTVVVIAVPDA